MPTNLPDQNWTVPAGPDPADAPVGFTDFAGDVLGNVILRYPDTATRDAFNGSRVAGDISFVIGRTWYDRWTGSKWLPCTTIAKAKTANQIVNNSSVFVNDNELFLPLPVANTWYDVSTLVRYTSAQAADIKFTYTAPAGATVIMAGPGMVTVAAGQSSDADWEGITAPAARPYGGAGGVSISAYRVHATVLTGANTGTLQFQWAQNTADPSNTTLFNFSTIRMDAIQ